MNKIYTVTAYKYGKRDGHSYILGVYTNKSAALKDAYAEEDFRGGKYICEVIQWLPNLFNKDNTPGTMGLRIKPLPP